MNRSMKDRNSFYCINIPRIRSYPPTIGFSQGLCVGKVACEWTPTIGFSQTAGNDGIHYMDNNTVYE